MNNQGVSFLYKLIEFGSLIIIIFSFVGFTSNQKVFFKWIIEELITLPVNKKNMKIIRGRRTPNLY